MTFALVILGPLDRRSGGYSYDVDLLKALETLGHRVEVWSLPSRGASATLKSRMQAEPDVVVFDALVHTAILSLLPTLRSRSRARWVGLVHHLAWLEDPVPGRQTERKKRDERRFLALMDALWFNSEDTRSSVAQMWGESASRPSVVLRPPLPTGGEFLVPTGRGRLLFLANLLPRKNLLLLLEALALLAKRRPDLPWTLTVAGSPSLAPRYARKCRVRARSLGLEGRLVWAGRVSDERRDELWRECDLLALPSSHEGWGMAHAEALNRGLPALAVPKGGVLEVLGDAALWAPAEADALATALERYLGDAAVRDDLARRARHRAPALRATTGFDPLASFLDDWNRLESPPPQAELDFGRYLEAKASVDARSLHPRVADAVWSGEAPRVVWDLGGGTGTMARRLRDQERIGPEVDYLLVDQDPTSLAAARRASESRFGAGRFRTLEADLLTFWESPPSPAPDLVIAHALLDLFDPASAAPALARLGARRYWLTHLFDGLTSWEPVLDPVLDRSLAEAYHRSMDERAPGGARGSARSGRDWLEALPKAGFRVLDVGASDWVARPVGGRYPAEEALFLESMLHFFRTSLTGRADVDQAGLAWWLAVRQGQILRAEASLVVHQLDLAAELDR